MAYDFETLVPAIDADSPMRRQLKAGNYPDDVIDYGIAEMKFPLFSKVSDGIVDLLKNGVLGYSAGNDEFYAAVCSWMKKRHNWDILPEYINQTYGVVQAIGISIKAFTNPGDGILIQTPVYNPFSMQIESNGRTIVRNPLKFVNGRYEIDFADFEEKVKQVKMFIICSPHNPVGRVWTKEELKKMADICLANNVLVLSDEIHSDLVFGAEHTVFATISEEMSENCIVCTAPSKTFNIPGLITSNIIIKNEELRNKFVAERNKCISHYVNPVGCTACRCAYETGEEWVDELCQYIKGNYLTLKKLLQEKVPGAVLTEMEGTYLAWIDMSFLGYDYDTLVKFFKEEACLPVNMGYTYGEEGKSFVRVNIGCPRRYVEDFVNRLEKAIKSK